jgi:hypothetical protein
MEWSCSILKKLEQSRSTLTVPKPNAIVTK